MVWRRDDDQHRQRVVWEQITYQARWHYDCLVEYALRNEVWDGVIALRTALRQSDVPDPNGCHDELDAAGLLDRFNRDGTPVVRLAEIGNHIPPEELRKAKDRARKRKSRKEACSAGSHNRHCPPETCPVKLAEAEVEISPQPAPVPVPVPVPEGPRTQVRTQPRTLRDCCDDPALTSWANSTVCRNCGVRQSA